MFDHHSDENAVAAGANTCLAASPSAPIDVWLVDDNQPLRNTLREFLDQCDGLRCKATFHSPNAVLSTLASKAGPDVILLDIRMGEACGLDAIRPIKALSRSTQVLMLTTHFDSQSKKRALADGASGLSSSTFPLEQILDSIHKAAREPAPHLKRSARTNPTGNVASLESASPASSLLSTSPAGKPTRRFLWLKHCLNVFHPRWN